ncbi:UPF0280 family protein [bacterium]|nr:UPF0280 family protein [bacterium]
MTGPQIAKLPDGRLHLQHGPIDLICEAWGDGDAVTLAHDLAAQRFGTILAELATELPALRLADAPVNGTVARKMAAAVAPFRPAFVTPMAAVAGAVAETILAAMLPAGLSRAYVNNGGDIALHLAPGQQLTAAIAGTPHRITIRAADRVRGIATSGWGGRSFSLGIADSVTVLAATAAMADAAATMVANAVDLPGHPGIQRASASSLRSDSDLGELLVTTGVAALSGAECDAALDRGADFAATCLVRGLIYGAALCLGSHLRTVGAPFLSEIVHA